MKRYTIKAYDTNHNELWISAGWTHDGAEPSIHTDHVSDVVNTYALRTGKIIDSETGLPVARLRDPQTGQRAQGSKLIAYFRAYDQDMIWEINITRHGRKAGIRNYQTRSPLDPRTGQIIGHPPIHTGIRVESNGYGGLVSIIGEGDPDGLRLSGEPYTDKWGDDVRTLGSCQRAFKIESGWWGYTYQNHCTWELRSMENATAQDVHKHLLAEAQKLEAKYGPDFTRW